MQGGQFDTADNLTPRTIWHHHKFYISTIVWPRNMIRNILIATIYLFDWILSCKMSLYQIRARQGPHIKTYLISWQLFGPKISLEIHCWPITTFFKTVGENFSQCQIVLFCMMVSNCPILHDGVKLSAVSNGPRISHWNSHWSQKFFGEGLPIELERKQKLFWNPYGNRNGIR